NFSIYSKSKHPFLLDTDLNNAFLNFNALRLNSSGILGCLIFSVLLSLFIFSKEYKKEYLRY
ncbi:TPA: hypothetical protein ACSB7I_003431, partial [Clostridioides difficile]